MHRSLVALLVLPLLSSCGLISEAVDAGGLCLDEVLEEANLKRSGLDDTVLADALAATVDFIDGLPVKDCKARNDYWDLIDDTEAEADGSKKESPDLPDKPREGQVHEVDSAPELPEKVTEVIQEGPGKGMDVVILMDTTGSMTDDADELTAQIDSIVDKVKAKDGRVGIAWYGDNQSCDSPWFGMIGDGLMNPNNAAIEEFRNNGLRDQIAGGCDWPESMYDAIWATADGYDWQSADRTIIVITDADPLTGNATNHSKKDVSDILNQKVIALDVILTAVSYW